MGKWCGDPVVARVGGKKNMGKVKNNVYKPGWGRNKKIKKHRHKS